MKSFNSLEEIYSKGIADVGDKFVCSVCNKEYLNLKLALKHFNKQRCHTTKDVFGGTITEDKLYDLAKYIHGSFVSIKGNKKSGVLSKKRFIANKSFYGFAGNLYLFSISNSITDLKDYISFVILLYAGSWNCLTGIYKIALAEETLSEYYKDRRQNVTQQESKYFWEINKDKLLVSTEFLFRSIQRGDISAFYVFDKTSIHPHMVYELLHDVERYEAIDNQYSLKRGR